MNTFNKHFLNSKVFATLAVSATIMTFVIGTGFSASVAAASNPTRCKTGMLSVSLGKESAALGSNYYPLKFKNISSETCTLDGYPGVSALRNGKQLGSSATWSQSVPKRLVVLKSGKTATALFQVVSVENYVPNECKPETATELKVYAPGAYSAKVISDTLEGCSAPSIVYMSVQAVK